MLNLDNSIVDQLSEQFYGRSTPAIIAEPELLQFNHALAEFLGLDVNDLPNEQLAEFFAGQNLPEAIKPVAMAYAGHQFGQFVPQLGDGRAVLIGDVIATDDKRYDIQLKGSGQTDFSRNGDGKSALGPVIREYLMSEAMFNLGIPTTRSLAAVLTNEAVYRQNGPEPAGIFTRVARAHIRIGTIEYFASRQKLDELKALADFTIARLYPELKDSENPYLALFETVAERILSLVARWQGIGFIHGVMNTDNMSLAGETIDYGPCAFMDTFKADKKFSSIDRGGRYAYNQQPGIAQWNLSMLASCLVPLVDKDEKRAIEQLQAAMNVLPEVYEKAWLAVFRPKLGLFNELPEDRELIESILNDFEENEIDFTLGFRHLTNLKNDSHRARLELQEQGVEEAKELMDKHNPWLIPRNHHIEQAISESYQGDFSLFHRLQKAYEEPYKEKDENYDLTRPPSADQVVRRTFCGT